MAVIGFSAAAQAQPKRETVEQIQDRRDDACSKLGKWVRSNLVLQTEPNFAQWVKDCNENPEKELCRSVRINLKTGNETARSLDLHCGDGGKMIHDDACMILAAYARTGRNLLEHPDGTQWIKDCNANPVKDICEATRHILKSENARTELRCGE
jgi:hypothetical protein